MLGLLPTEKLNLGLGDLGDKKHTPKHANSNRNLHLSIFIANGLVFYRSFENVPYPKKPKTTRPIITHNVKGRNGLVFLAVF